MFAVIVKGSKENLTNVSIVMEFGALRSAFARYKKMHGKWPSSLRDLNIQNSHEISDPRTDQPYPCLADKHVYLCLPGGKTPKKVFAMAKVHRTNIWPFGKMQTIVLCGDNHAVHDIHYADPSQVVELSTKEVDKLSEEKD